MYHLEKKIESQGENITLNNTAKTPFEVFKVTGNSVQEGEPTPEVPIKIQNVGDNINLFNIQEYIDFYSLTETGIDDGHDYVAYTTKTYENTKFMQGQFEENTQYVLSFYGRQKTTSTQGVTTGFRFYYTDGTYKEKYVNNNEIWTKYTIVTDKNKTVDYILMLWAYEGTIWLSDIKLEEGTEPTAYSPYNCGSIDMIVCNKNFIDWSKLEKSSNITKIETTENTIKIYPTNKNSNFRVIFRQKLKPGNYSMKQQKIAVFSIDYDGGNVNLGNSTFRENFNLPKESILISWWFLGISEEYIELNKNDYQLEKNSKLTEYVEHEQQTITFPLSEGQKLMKGSYLADGGIHHVRKQIELVGTENWSLTARDNYYAFWLIYRDIGMVDKANFKICNYFMYENQVFNVAKINTICENRGSPNMIIFKVDFCKTVKEWKNWIIQKKQEGTPVIVEYELAEEVIEPYTEEQQEAYNQINSLYSYDEVTNIFSNNEISPIFDVGTFKMITKEFKQRLLNGKITRAYLKVLATDTKPEMIIDENNYLKDCTFEELRYVPDEGFIGGTVAKRVTGNFNNVDSSFSIQDREFELYLGVDLENGTTEYIKYGTFIVQKPEDDQVNDNTSFEALDYMIKLNLPWVDRMTYPCTLKELFDDLVAQSGLSTKVTSFLNQDFIVENNQFEEGTTRRDVLKAIAQMAFNWARIDEDNDIVMDFEKKDEVAETLTADNYYNFKKQDMYGPINVIILRNSQVEGENITIRDEESINAPKGKNLCPNINEWNLYNGAYIEDGYIILPNSNSFARIDVLWNKKSNSLKLNILFNSSFENYGVHIYTEYRDENNTLLSSNGAAYKDKNGEIIQNFIFGGNNKYGEAISKAKYIRIIITRSSSFASQEYKFKNVMCNSEELNYEPFIPNGETELVISDNPFAYTQAKRAELIEAGRILFGLTYIPMSMDMIGYMYLNCKDKIKATNLNNETFETYLLNHTIEYAGTISDSMEAPAATNTETKYQFTPPMIEALKHTELLVDKANQRIDAVIKNISDTNEKMVEIEATLDGVTSTVKSVVQIANEAKETAEQTSEKFENLQSGANNLIINSGYFNNTDSWEANGDGIILNVENFDGFNCIKSTGSIVYSYDKLPLYNAGFIRLEPNSTYIIQLEIYLYRELAEEETDITYPIDISTPLHTYVNSMKSTGVVMSGNNAIDSENGASVKKTLLSSSSYKTNEWVKIQLKIETGNPTLDYPYYAIKPFIWRSYCWNNRWKYSLYEKYLCKTNKYYFRLVAFSK